jgi:hypothetical protein
MAHKFRAFGSIPDEHRSGPITRKNYNFRAEKYCADHSAEREGIHPTITLDSPQFPAWMEYFDRHLGGRPKAFQMLCAREIMEMTVPQRQPEWFDDSFKGKAKSIEPEPPDDPAARERMAKKLEQLAADMKAGKLKDPEYLRQWERERTSPIPLRNLSSVLIGTSDPRYAAIVERANQAGPCILWQNDPHGRGIWVVHSWAEKMGERR